MTTKTVRSSYTKVITFFNFMFISTKNLKGLSLLIYFIDYALRGTRTLTLKALVPKTSVSTNSTRRALIILFLRKGRDSNPR